MRCYLFRRDDFTPATPLTLKVIINYVLYRVCKHLGLHSKSFSYTLIENAKNSSWFSYFKIYILDLHLQAWLLYISNLNVFKKLDCIDWTVQLINSEFGDCFCHRRCGLFLSDFTGMLCCKQIWRKSLFSLCTWRNGIDEDPHEAYIWHSGSIEFYINTTRHVHMTSG